MECCVCLEKVANTVQCDSCDEKAPKYCFSCLLSYLGQNMTAFNCIICKNKFSVAAIQHKIPNKFKNMFLKLLRDHNNYSMKYYLSSSKYLIPKVKDNIDTLSKIENINNNIKELQKQLEVAEKEKDTLNVKYNAEREDIYTYKENSVYFSCPNPSCGGGIDIKAAICNLCRSDVCTDCLQIIKDDEVHSCNLEILNSVKEILGTSRPCPKCKQLINKAEGCSIMYCVDCKTPFNWITGEVVKGGFHNPHMEQIAAKAFTVDYNVLNSEEFRNVKETDVPRELHAFIVYYYSLKISMEILKENYATLQGKNRYKSALVLLGKLEELKAKEFLHTSFVMLNSFAYILQELLYIKNVIEMAFNISKDAPKDILRDIIGMSSINLRKHESKLSPLFEIMISMELPVVNIIHMRR